MLLLRYKTISTMYFTLCMILIAFFMLIDMSGMEHGATPLPGIGMVACAAAFCCMFSVWKFLVIPGYKAYRPNMTIALYVFFFCWSLIITVLNDNSPSFIDSLTTFMRQTLPLFALLLPYNYILNHNNISRKVGIAFCVTVVLFALHYFYLMSQIIITGFVPHMIVSYYTLYLLPLIYITCGKKINILFTLIVAVILITSIKRLGIAAMAAAMFVTCVVYNYINPRIKWGAFIGALFVTAIIVGVFVFVGDSDENNLIERFESIQEDEGSGRTVVWAKAIQLIENSDFDKFIVGHGFNRVVVDSQAGLSAHDDFLEIIYDYGLIGFILYVFAFLSYAKDLIVMIVRKNKLAPILTFAFSVYFIMSLPSHVIIYPWASIVMFTISYVYSIEKNAVIKKNNN